MAADLYQRPKIYLIIGEHQELIEKIKNKLAEQPLVEVYVLRPSFFLHPEFAKNAVWKKEIERIFWVIAGQSEESWSEQNKIIRAVGAKLIELQDKLRIVFLNYSPPPLKTTDEVEEIVLRWRQQGWWESDWRVKLALEMPQATMVIGQDVLFDSQTLEVPIQQILSLVKKEIWPVVEGQEVFYWQLSDDFFEVAWKKLLSPLKSKHFWLKGKKIAAQKQTEEFDRLLGEIKGYGLEKVVGETDRSRRQILQTQIRTWSEIEVEGAIGVQDLIWNKWGAYFDLGQKQKKKKDQPKKDVTSDFEEITTGWKKWPKPPKKTEVKKVLSEVEVVVIPEKKVKQEEKKQKSAPKEIKKEKTKKETAQNRQDVEELKDKIQEALKVIDEPLPSPRERKQKRTQKRLGIALCLVGAGAILVMGAGWLYWQNVETKYYRQLEMVLGECWQDVEKCDWEVEAAKLQALDGSLREQRRIYQLITANETSNQDLETWKEIVNQLIRINYNQGQIKQAAQDIYLGVVGRGNQSWKALEKWQILADLSWQNDQANLKMSSLLNQVEGKGWQIDNFVEEVKQSLSLEKEKNAKMLEEMQLWREIWGRKGEVNYGIALFNSSQLRPAGGTLEAILVIKVIDGEIKSVVPYSLDEVEQAVKNKPIASGFEEEFLETNKGSLREIGRDVDFELTANKIKWYLDQVMLNREIDGLIGINLDLLAQETGRGEIFGAGEGTRLNRDNYLTEIKRFNQEKEMVRQNSYKNLLTAIGQEKMLYAGGEALEELKNLGQLKASRGLVFWMNDPGLEERVKQTGWSGATLEVNCQLAFGTNNCVNDSFYYGVSSLGEGDGREGLGMLFNEEVQVKRDRVEHVIKLDVTQASKIDYVFDFYWPQKATNRLLTVNGEPSGGKWGNGVLLSFSGKGGERQTIELKYELLRPDAGRSGGEVEAEAPFYYSYLQGKMAGLNGVQTQLNLINESGLPISLVAPKAAITEQGLRFEDNGKGEIFVTVEFGK